MIIPCLEHIDVDSVMAQSAHPCMDVTLPAKGLRRSAYHTPEQNSGLSTSMIGEGVTGIEPTVLLDPLEPTGDRQWRLGSSGGRSSLAARLTGALPFFFETCPFSVTGVDTLPRCSGLSWSFKRLHHKCWLPALVCSGLVVMKGSNCTYRRD